MRLPTIVGCFILLSMVLIHLHITKVKQAYEAGYRDGWEDQFLPYDSAGGK